MATPDQPPGERLAALEVKVSDIIIPKLETLNKSTDRIEMRLDELSLNGHGPDLKELANVAPKLVELARKADALGEVAADRVEADLVAKRREAKNRWLSTRLGIASVVVGILVGLVLAATAVISALGVVDPGVIGHL